MQFCPTAFRIVYALNGLPDRKCFPGKIDILHLQCTKLPNAYTREKRKEESLPSYGSLSNRVFESIRVPDRARELKHGVMNRALGS